MTPQEKLIAVAKAEVGYHEKASNAFLDSDTANAGKKNWTKYARDLDALGDFYNGKKNGYDWCDVFVDWCHVTAFGKEMALQLLEAPLRSCGAGVKYSADYYKGDLYKNAGQFYESDPQPADQIFFGTSTTWQHTGLVVDVDSQYVYTAEGNTSDGMVALCKYRLNDPKILGYGRPDWSLVGGSSNPTTAQTTTKVDTSGKKNLEFDKGDTVSFIGSTHYTSANAAKGKSCKPGKAKVIGTFPTGKHPYQLKYVAGGGSTVYGWVDVSDVSAAAESDTDLIYIVQKGDTLWSIAKKFLGNGFKYKTIMTLNGLKSQNIHIGQKLKLPK